MTTEQALKLALASEFGIVLETPDPRTILLRLKQEIHKNKELYGTLTPTPSRTNPTREIWIIRNARKA